VQFEKIQKFADKPLTRCPECRTGRVKRLLQPPAIVFKGSGWYVTDHRSPNSASKRTEGESSSNSSKEKESTSKGKGEAVTEPSKPAKKEAKEAKSAKSDD